MAHTASTAIAAAPRSPLPAPAPALTAAEQRRILRARIARLETELAAHAWDDRRRPAPNRPLSTAPVPRIGSVEELERIRDEMAAKLARLRGAARRRGSGHEAAAARLEAILEHPSRHRWEIVRSEDLGHPGCRSWRVVPRFGPIGAIVGWWRVKVSSGCPLSGPREAR